jgi:preprotein translocase subunit SecG
MENVVLIIHLLLALALIGVVLMQRSEGGGLGMGGGGGGGGVMSGRGAATALGKVTWLLAIAFIATSITLTIFAAQNSAGSSVVDRLGAEAPADETPEAPALPETDGLLPPPAADPDAPLVPRAE